MKLLSGTFTLLTAALMILGSISCSSSDQGSDDANGITKVKYYHMDPTNRVRTLDQMISFEERYHRYGAVNNEQLLEKTGFYYSVFWKAEDRNADIKLRLDYRHRSTGPKEYSFEITPDEVRKRNVTKFAVIGDEYQKLGPVTAWKVSLIINGEITGDKQSFLWE